MENIENMETELSEPMGNIENMETELGKLVMTGNCKGVNGLVKKYKIEVLRGVTPQGNSALHIAAARGHHEMVKLLVGLMPCMLLKKNSNKETPLHTAARFGNSETIQALLNVQNGLQCNCSSPCLQNVDLEASPKDVREIWIARTKDGETALHYAVKGDNLEAAQQLLNKVQDIQLIVNNVGESALYTACYYGRLEIGKKLLSGTPSVGDTRKDGTSCLHQAIINILDWWDEENDYSSWFSTKSKTGRRQQHHDFALKLAFELVEKRPALAKAVDSSGNSPLHLLVKLKFPHESHLELVEKLLAKLAFMNFTKNKDGMAPLHIAARDGHVKVIRRLIDNAPHCSYLLGAENRNALHYALEQEDGFSVVSKVLWLLKDPVDIGFLLNEPDNEGKTAVCKAKMRLNVADEESVPSLWQYIAFRILQRITKNSRPCPSKSSQLDLKKAVAVHEAKGDQSKVDGEERVSVIAAAAQSKKNVEEKDERERLSVVAALIATITFAAAFTIPGGFNAVNGSPVFIHQAALKTFILSDSLAFSLSFLALFNFFDCDYRVLGQIFGQYAIVKRIGNRKNFEDGRASWGRQLLDSSLTTTVVVFASGLYVVVAPKCYWLAITVCAITFGGFLLGSIQTLSFMAKLAMDLAVDIFRLAMDLLLPSDQFTQLRSLLSSNN